MLSDGPVIKIADRSNTVYRQRTMQGPERTAEACAVIKGTQKETPKPGNSHNAVAPTEGATTIFGNIVKPFF